MDGGAIALHPLGATGTRITAKAAQILKRENKKYALSTQCIGLGQGIATILQSIININFLKKKYIYNLIICSFIKLQLKI